jgi:hypothetical protein
MVRAGEFKSPTVSSTNELPAEQPFIASAVKIQSIVRGFAARKRVAKVLEKQRKNREKKQIRQHRTRRKKERRIKIVRKTSALTPELMALKTPTQICEVQTTNQCPSELPAGHLGYTYTTLICGAMESPLHD